MDRIAVTTDFSEDSRRSFVAAAALSRKFASKLFVINVAQIPPPVVSPWPDVVTYSLPENIFELIQERLAELVAKEEVFQGLEVERRVFAGDTVEAVQSFLVEEKIKLLVIATHGLTGFKRFLLGSVTDKILRVAPCPVLVYRKGTYADPAGAAAAAAAGSGTTAASAQFAPRRILVPHDLSQNSRPAVTMARDWARTFGAKAQILFVVGESAMLYGYAAEAAGDIRQYEEKVRAEGLRRLEQVITSQWQGVETSATAVLGQPALEILRAAEKMKADLIVMGTHGRSGLEHFFLGSVTEKTIRKAACPVLVVPSAGAPGAA